MAALDYRERTGEGMVLDFSQAEGGIHFVTEAILDQEVNGFPQSRMGNADRWMAPHSVYECANGQKDQWIAIACENDEQWRALTQAIDLEELSSLGLSQRLAREEELDQILRDWCLSRDATETTELLQGAGVPAHQVQNSPEVTSDPQLIYRNHFVEVPHEIYDTTWAEQYGFRLSKSDGTPTKSGPLWGCLLYTSDAADE